MNFRRATVILTAIVCLLIVALPSVSFAATSHCNCWEGNYICTYYDDEGVYTGLFYQENSSVC